MKNNKSIGLWLSVAFTLTYLVAELLYNLGLVEFLSSKNTEISVISHLETFGKSISALGLALFISKLIPRWKLAAIAVLVPVLFISEGFIFDSIITNLPKAEKVAGYYLGVYRSAVLNGDIEDKEIGKAPYSAKQKVLLTNIILKGSGIEPGVKGFLYGAKLPTDVIHELYTSYNQIDTKIGSYYGAYALASKKFLMLPQMVQQKASGKFLAGTGGIPPGLDKQGFMASVKKSYPQLTQYMGTVLVPANAELGIEQLTVADLPSGLDETQFTSFLEGKYKDVLQKSQITEGTVEHLPHSRDLITAVFIPPMAMGLSLLSLCLNSFSVLWLVFGRNSLMKAFVGVSGALAVGFLVFSAQSSSYQVNPAWKTVLYGEEKLLQAVGSGMEVIHKAFIDDNHPDSTQIIHIQRVGAIDSHAIDEKMAELQKFNDSQALPKVDDSIKVDESRINDQGYFGQVKTDGNPYVSGN